MCKIVAVIMVSSALSLSAQSAHTQELFSDKSGNIRNVDTRAMLSDGGAMYLATRTEVYRAADDKWRSIFLLPSGASEISCIGGSSKNILIGTNRGLYRSQDNGKNWRNVFRTIIREKSSVLTIEASRHNPKKVMIGTERGIFLSEDGAASWRDVSGVLKNRRVSYIALNKEYIYAGADDGLYIGKDGSYDWERAYVRTSSADSAENTEALPDDIEIEEAVEGGISCIALKDSRLYVGTGKKILYSDDGWKNWNTFATEGLAGYVNHILASALSKSLYCATTKGVFEFAGDKKRWFELYRGTEKVLNAGSIVFGGEGEKSIWVLTDKGLYKLESGAFMADGYIDVERNLKTMKIMFDNEPSVTELQQAAMSFNEVSPEKISQWRAQARMRALVPKIGFGMDKSRSNTYEIYTSATKDYVISGPDDIGEGFNVSVSWELGDLIWSDDQTNIDVRSRLNTQLRNDILDDLRRAYYERKRLQFEVMTSPPKDPKIRFERELRIQELTQAIDDLTGNYLSGHVKDSQQSTLHSR